MNISKQQMAAVFNEWAKRYSETPDAFGEILDENGKPVTDCGDVCAEYFSQIAKEMFSIFD
jgi:hypothetical protein